MSRLSNTTGGQQYINQMRHTRTMNENLKRLGYDVWISANFNPIINDVNGAKVNVNNFEPNPDLKMLCYPICKLESFHNGDIFRVSEENMHLEQLIIDNFWNLSLQIQGELEIKYLHDLRIVKDAVLSVDIAHKVEIDECLICNKTVTWDQTDAFQTTGTKSWCHKRCWPYCELKRQ